MSAHSYAASGYLLIALLLGACSTKPVLLAPDTLPGDRIKHEYLVGDWCTNREQTAKSNQQAGFSGLLNVAPVFWRFETDGNWETSSSGYLFVNLGSWKLEGLDTLVLKQEGSEPMRRQVQFRNTGADLFLIDDKGQFRVLARCK